MKEIIEINTSKILKIISSNRLQVFVIFFLTFFLITGGYFISNFNKKVSTRIELDTIEKNQYTDAFLKDVLRNKYIATILKNNSLGFVKHQIDTKLILFTSSSESSSKETLELIYKRVFPKTLEAISHSYSRDIEALSKELMSFEGICLNEAEKKKAHERLAKELDLSFNKNFYNQQPEYLQGFKALNHQIKNPYIFCTLSDKIYSIKEEINAKLSFNSLLKNKNISDILEVKTFQEEHTIGLVKYIKVGVLSIILGIVFSLLYILLKYRNDKDQ